MPHHDEEWREESGSFTGTLAWFLAGAAVGTAIGILFAPRSGKETREAIGRKVEEGRATSRGWLNQSCEFFESTRQLVDDAVDLFERGRRLAEGS